MTPEEKAKAYDDAIERARTIVENRNASSVWKDWLCNTFPELQESGDESIRKEIYQFVYEQRPEANWLAWLEKQCSDISSFPENQRKYMEKYTSLNKVTLIKLLAERDMNVEECINSFEKQYEQKWTEEDENNINMAIDFMRNENTPYSPTDVEPVVEWLRGLKQRMKEQ